MKKTITEVTVDRAEYQKVAEHYTDRKGKVSYELLNKDLIKFAHLSSRVRAMIEAGATEKSIRNYVVGTKFRNITENRDLTDEQALKIAELLDEENAKGVFKEFNSELRRKLGANKKK